MELNCLRDEVYQNAIKHGWHDFNRPDEHWLMMVITEISEAVNADRKNIHADRNAFERNCAWWHLERHTEKGTELFERYIKDTVEDELADIVIRLLDFSGLRVFDLNLNISNIDTNTGLRDKFRIISFTEFCFTLCEEITHSPNRYECVKKTLTKIFQYAKVKDIDLSWFVGQKMIYNRSRPFKHGGKSY